MSTGVEETWPAEPAAVPRVRAAVVALARAAKATDDALDDIRLAVSEAATNVVVHAYVDAPPGPLHLRATVEGRRLRVEVRDEGGGLRARPDSPGLGVGLPLMAAVTESLQLSNAEGEPSTVTMTFDLDLVRDRVA
ncbi:MAG TPA: ATP-binding protein [Solirubrobacteraceae bacterium]|jgi:anti-sigma regulatory factor (Ser/Thr protein kinase)